MSVSYTHLDVYKRQVTEINELEKILDIFQNIRDREMGRRQNPPVSHTNGSHHQSRGSTTAHRGARGDNNRSEGGGVRIVGLRIILSEQFVIDAAGRGIASETNQHPTRTINTREEKTVAEEHLEAVEIQPGVEVVTHRAVPPPNRKTSEDNGGGDPTIARR